MVWFFGTKKEGENITSIEESNGANGATPEKPYVKDSSKSLVENNGVQGGTSFVENNGTQGETSINKHNAEEEGAFTVENGAGSPEGGPRVKEEDNGQKNAGPKADVKDPEVVLKKILGMMGFETEVFREDKEDQTRLTIYGKEGALLIGRRGQTLDALEYLLNKVCAPWEKANHKRIYLDTEDYRQKREEKIVSLARKLAYKVEDTKTPEVFLPLKPLERKIVHTTLKNHPTLETKSQGEGFYKKIVISYKRS